MQLANDNVMHNLAAEAGVGYVRVVKYTNTDGGVQGAPLIEVDDKESVVVCGDTILNPMPQEDKSMGIIEARRRALEERDPAMRRIRQQLKHACGGRIPIVSTAGEPLNGAYYSEEDQKLYAHVKKPTSAKNVYLFRDYPADDKRPGDYHYLRGIRNAALIHTSVIELPKVIRVPVPVPVGRRDTSNEEIADIQRRAQDKQDRAARAALDHQERVARAEYKYRADTLRAQKDAVRAAQRQQEPGWQDMIGGELNRFKGYQPPKKLKKGLF